MKRGKKEISSYIRDRIYDGYSYKEISKAFVSSGYKKEQAVDILYNYIKSENRKLALGVFLLAVVFIATLGFGGASIANMVVLDYSRNFEENVDLFINESSYYSWYMPADGELLSISVTGTFPGRGRARIYINNAREKLLIYDSEISEGLAFEDSCVETCAIEGWERKVYDLEFVIEDSVIELDSIRYSVRAENDAIDLPEFTEIPGQRIGVGNYARFNLSSFFNSTQKASFGYIAEEGTLSVYIEDDTATVMPLEEGKTYVYFVAGIEDLVFMSNLVEIDSVSEGTPDINVEGAVMKEKTEMKGERNDIFIVIILVLAIMGLLFFASIILVKNKKHLSRIKK